MASWSVGVGRSPTLGATAPGDPGTGAVPVTSWEPWTRPGICTAVAWAGLAAWAGLETGWVVTLPPGAGGCGGWFTVLGATPGFTTGTVAGG